MASQPTTFSPRSNKQMTLGLSFEPMEWSTMLTKKQPFFHMIEAQIANCLVVKLKTNTNTISRSS